MVAAPAMLAAMIRVLVRELDATGHAERERRLLPRLHAEEQARYRGFGAAARQESWLAGRELLLAALGQELDEVDAAALRTAGSGGIRYDSATIHLNLSHSGALLAAAVAPRPVGIDIERVRPRTVAAQVERVFCPVEAQAFSRLSNEARLQRFFQLWTLKEAACKAAGLSIWDGLGGACFDLDTGRCRLSPPFPAGPWRLLHGGFDTGWRLAVAVRDASLELSCRRGGPGTWHELRLESVQSLRHE